MGFDFGCLAQGELLRSLDVCLPSSVVRRQQLLKRTAPPKLLVGLLTSLAEMNDPYIDLFSNCTYGFRSIAYLGHTS